MRDRDSELLIAAAIRATVPSAGSVPAATARASSSPWPDGPLAESEWRRLLQVARSNRVTGALLEAVLAGLLPADDDQYEELARVHVGSMTVAVRLDRMLVRVGRALAAEGVDVVVLKGPAVAHLDYPHRSMRAYGDVDLLVRAESLGRVDAVLRALGHDRPATALGRDFDEQYGKGATWVGPEGLEVDVHRTLIFGPLGVGIDVEDLFVDPDRFVVGGVEMTALRSPLRYLHACYHAALGSHVPRWSTLHDVLLLHPEGGDEAAEVIDVARRWGAEVVLKRTHALVAGSLGVELTGPVADLAAAHQPTPRERRALDTYVGRRRTFTAQVLATLPYLPSGRDRLGLLRDIVTADPDGIRSRGTAGRVAWFRRGWRSLARELRR